MLMWLGLLGMGISPAGFTVDGSVSVEAEQTDVSISGEDGNITATSSSPDITVQT